MTHPFQQLQGAGRTPAQLIADYHNRDLDPLTTPNKVMIVGTGGVGLWERHWSKLALAGAANPRAKKYELYRNGQRTAGLMRAMCFAQDAGRQHRITTINLSSEIFRHTAAGSRLTQRFNDTLAGIHIEPGMTGPARVITEQSTIRMTQFSGEHGSRWEDLAQDLLQIAQNALDLGIHLTAMGIYHADEHRIKLGGRIMAEAPRWLGEQLDHPSPSQAKELPEYTELIPSGNRPAERNRLVQEEIDQFTARIRTSEAEIADRKQAYVAELSDHKLIMGLVEMTVHQPYAAMNQDHRQMWNQLKDEIHRRINN